MYVMQCLVTLTVMMMMLITMFGEMEVRKQCQESLAVHSDPETTVTLFECEMKEFFMDRD